MVRSRGSLRITGGAWRSRLVAVEAAHSLRPTPDRVRETLFNWLGQDLGGCSCLDLFAGSGILGFECASRGAAEVVMVENDARVFARLRANADLFAAPALKPVRADALEFAAAAGRQGRCFDLLLLDPPYHKGWLQRLAPMLAALSGAATQMYLEAEELVAAPQGWRAIRNGRAGQVFFQLMGRA